MDRTAHAPGRDVISDVTAVQRRQSAAADLAAAAAAVVNANYRFTVGPDDAFPLPPSPLVVRPKNSSSGLELCI